MNRFQRLCESWPVESWPCSKMSRGATKPGPPCLIRGGIWSKGLHEDIFIRTLNPSKLRISNFKLQFNRSFHFSSDEQPYTCRSHRRKKSLESGCRNGQNCRECLGEVTANLTREILSTEGVMFSQLGKCITDSDLEEIGE
jgi:hypothetical protein